MCTLTVPIRPHNITPCITLQVLTPQKVLFFTFSKHFVRTTIWHILFTNPQSWSQIGPAILAAIGFKARDSPAPWSLQIWWIQSLQTILRVDSSYKLDESDYVGTNFFQIFHWYPLHASLIQVFLFLFFCLFVFLAMVGWLDSWQLNKFTWTNC